MGCKLGKSDKLQAKYLGKERERHLNLGGFTSFRAVNVVYFCGLSNESHLSNCVLIRRQYLKE